ncbi:hypothetical protein F5B17DRAFT_431775 [Nemania serpens]|nr:hypothetical protein F5B17DRAFT_431775 [Nemania serpens]
MARMASFSPIASLLLLLLSLSLLHVPFANAAAIQFRSAIAPRQSPAAVPLPSPSSSASASTSTTPLPSSIPVSCAEYGRIANLSTIALNSTLRGAFLRSSSLGTFPAAAVLDVESPKLMSLMLDAELNRQCGNLSALAVVEAGRNLTAGTVAGMKILDAPGVAPANVALPILCVLFIIMLGAPASSI